MAKKEIAYQDVNCPRCGKTIISHQPIDYIYGSPLRECPYCGESYIDPFVHEIEIDGLRRDPRIVKKLFRDLLLCGIMTIIMVALNLLSVMTESVSYVMILLMFVCFFLGLYKITIFFVNKKDMKKQYAKQIQESAARMSDKEYARKLKDYGLQVPAKYL